jgi:hypothetical protein
MDKKHEDVGGVAQIDKTTVFQDGRPAQQPAMTMTRRGDR